MLPCAIVQALRQVRSQDWWEFKMPPVLAAAYGSILIARPAPAYALATIATLVFSISCVAAYGYLINDLFDIEDDRLGGKPNVMDGKPAWTRFALCSGAA